MTKVIVAVVSDREYPHGNPDKAVAVAVADDEHPEAPTLDEDSERWRDEIGLLEQGEAIPLWDDE